MCWTRVVVRDPFVGAFGLDLIQRRFELTNRAHVAPDAREIMWSKTRKAFLNGLLVRIDRNVREADRLPGEDTFRFDDDRLRHPGLHLTQSDRSILYVQSSL